jgi:FtsP/CotA-like multicopper oxidase with cupredoxin domain
VRTWATTQSDPEHRLVAGPARVPLVGGQYPDTDAWAYNGSVPGPELRFRQGQRVRIVVENRLQEDTTVHWHGVRVPNAMDGVPHLTQAPIAPGETFTYEFDLPDAGTYWYHPHERSFEQVGRGLYGPLIVEEPQPIRVDRDIAWVLDDWRLRPDAEIRDDFGNFMDTSHAGSIGNTVTINGRVPSTFAVRANERIRLRLINAANARIFSLEFQGHRPRVIALDGQPVEPHEPSNGRVVLGPAQRADLVIDMTARPGEPHAVIDGFYKDSAYKLVDIAYETESLREAPIDTPIRLAKNPVPEPDLGTAQRHEIVFGGGMMSSNMMSGEAMEQMMRRMMGGGMMGDGMMGRGMMGDGMTGGMMRGRSDGKIWTVNGVSTTGHLHKPFLTLERGRSYALAMHNDTAFHHPIHLHGHAFRVLSRNDKPTTYREWQDTALMAPRERVEIAFVADNPGDWMIHCHILEHQAGGMMGTIRI